MQDSLVYREFLHELSVFDRFVQERARNRADIERHDPDVRRLVEALAFFSARSRICASEEATSALARLAGDYFEALLAPLPTMAMMQATPTTRFVEPAFLPQDLCVRVTAKDGSATESAALFSSMRSGVVEPMRLSYEGLDYHRSRGFRITLALDRWVSGDERPPAVNLYLSGLDEYLGGLELQYALRRHLTRATVMYQRRPSSEDVGALCNVSFGALPLDLQRDDGRNPLWQIRSFFQCPQQNLFANVKLAAAPAGWRRAWLMLDVGTSWPADQYVGEDSFSLGVLPLVNLRRAISAPIRCDGTLDLFDILPESPDPTVELHSVRGVFKLVDKALVPLSPLALPNAAEGFEIVRQADRAGRPRHKLSVRLPSAFEAPVTLCVDALWHQPAFEQRALGELVMALQHRKVEGVGFAQHGDLIRNQPGALAESEIDLMRLVALRNKRQLNRGELVGLMELLGAGPASYHADMGALIDDVEVTERPLASGRGTQLVYVLALGDVADDQLALMLDYLSQVWYLLQSWSSADVELEVTLRGRAAPRLQPARPSP